MTADWLALISIALLATLVMGLLLAPSVATSKLAIFLVAAIARRPVSADDACVAAPRTTLHELDRRPNQVA